MFLSHNTNLRSLKNILKDGYLKSYSLLKSEGYNMKKIEGEGWGLYTENNFVYFSCVKELFTYKIISQITLYFTSDLLFNRTFYISNHHTSFPDKLIEYKDKNIVIYRRKYKRFYKNYNRVLENLFNYSISVSKKSFQAYQQIAVLNKINLDKLICIEFNYKDDANKNIVRYIKKYYPNVEIKINENFVID
jgi:hypothetical protein